MSRALVSLNIAMTLFAATGGVSHAADRPNIVFVLFDDLGYGQPPMNRADSEFKTPNLARLGREGMRFTDAHSASAVCTPTRYGVLTGRYPSRIGQFGVLTTYSPPIIPTTRLTVASLLRQHGYHTACFGKWHLGVNWVDGKPGTEAKVPVGARLSDGPNAVGFDVFSGFTHARNISSLIEQDRVVANIGAIESQPILIRKAVDYIEERARQGGPFFLYFPMCPPHAPIVPAPEYLGKSGASDRVGNDPKYGDWLYQGDDMLGQLLDALDRQGLSENTLVIATSDNGAEHRAYPPLRESKRSIYEGGHRVPFVARWPGKIKAGAINHDTICLNDLMATAAEIVGARLPDDAGEDSVSLLPGLLGTSNGATRETTIHQSMAGDLAIRQGAWKLIFLKDGSRELYNLSTDLGENQDVIAAHPEIVARLTQLMQSCIDRGRSTPGGIQKNDAVISLDMKDNARKTTPGSRKKPRT
jgi:arylsulfatase A